MAICFISETRTSELGGSTARLVFGDSAGRCSITEPGAGMFKRHRTEWEEEENDESDQEEEEVKDVVLVTVEPY